MSLYDGSPTRQEFQELQQRVDELEQRLEQLEDDSG